MLAVFVIFWDNQAQTFEMHCTQIKSLIFKKIVKVMKYNVTDNIIGQQICMNNSVKNCGFNSNQFFVVYKRGKHTIICGQVWHADR